MLTLVRIPDAFRRLRESKSGGYAKMANESASAACKNWTAGSLPSR